MKFLDKNLFQLIRRLRVFILIFILSIEIVSLKAKLKQSPSDELKFDIIHPDTTHPNGISGGINLLTTPIGNSNGGNIFRFQGSDKQEEHESENLKSIISLSSQILNKKQYLYFFKYRSQFTVEDKEEEIFPFSANAGTEFTFGFLSWNLISYKASSALSGSTSYWLSQRNVKHDHWEAVFDHPTKVDVLEIKWRFPPKRFRVFFSLDDTSELISASDICDKMAYLTKEGQISNQPAADSEYNSIVFNKPLFAKRIRINLHETTQKNSFSIFYVKFYQKKSIILVKNEIYDPCRNYCWYINTDKPRAEVNVEAYACVQSVTMGNNQELFTYNRNRSLSHLNSNLCVGFNELNEVVLKECSEFHPAYTIFLHQDGSLYFKGYEDRCIYIDELMKKSMNHISSQTEITVTSQADNQTYKKDNIKIHGENYWHSAPGQRKIILQFLFGKIQSGPMTGQYENKKVDTIVIEWIKQPLKFMLYTWKPGQSWILRKTYNYYNEKKSEINLIGIEASAVMLVLDKSHGEDGFPAYAIKEVYIGYSSKKVKVGPCKEIRKKLKVFDFDGQALQMIDQTRPYEENIKKLSQTFDKLINVYTKIKINTKFISKTREVANEFIIKLNKVKTELGSDIKGLQNFKSEARIIKNEKMTHYLSKYEEEVFKSATTGSITESLVFGSKHMPAEDCLKIRKMKKNALSGFYYIKPECANKALRVFCDFTVFGDAVDIYIFNNDSVNQNPDLTYLGIQNYKDIRYQCAKLGLLAIQIESQSMVSRIYQLLTLVGYDLSKAIAIPLGYDYSCNNGKCYNIINSLNDSNSPAIMSFFSNQSYQKTHNSNPTKPGPFAGIGYSDTETMISFDANETIISGVICSTNHFKTDSSDDNVKSISCEMTVIANGDLFPEGSDILVKCSSDCQESIANAYGTNIYHASSAVCVSAIHNGVIGVQGGKIYVRLQKGLPKFEGSFSNGVRSKDYNKNESHLGFITKKFEPLCPIHQFINGERQNEEQRRSFLETTIFEESFTKAKESSSSTTIDKIKLDPYVLKGIDLEDLNKAGLIIKQANGLDKENIEYNKLIKDFIAGANKIKDMSRKDVQSIKNTNNEINKVTLTQPFNPQSIPNETSVNYNRSCQPTTYDGIIEMKEIRKASDWDFLTELQMKNEVVEKLIANFNNNAVWSKANSKLSNINILHQYHTVDLLQQRILFVMKKLIDKARIRVNRTNKIKNKWNENLLKLQFTDNEAINYEKNPEKLFNEIFIIEDMKSEYKSNWKLHSAEIKNRPRAIGNTSKIFSKNQYAASMIRLQKNRLYDFSLTVDILVKSIGKAGIAFHVVDIFNYYAFVIDKKKGYKSIVKVVNGNKINLIKIIDGGILLNDWHSVNIQIVSGNIRVYFYNMERSHRESSEKIIDVYDNHFVKGTFGFFVNNMEGFFFDYVMIVPLPCWTPWTPSNTSLQEIIIPNASVLVEDFRGSLTDRFSFIDLLDAERDGPSEWVMSSEGIPGITQNSLVYDGSSKKQSSMIVYKNKQITNGVFITCFYADNTEGMVSIIFKYSNDILTTNSQLKLNEKYYSFDLINSIQNPQFVLRKFTEGSAKVLYEVNTEIIGIATLGYITGLKTCVEIETKGDRIIIKVSIGDSPTTQIINLRDESIKNGRIGFGTYRTKCKFTRVEMFPPKIELSQTDRDLIINSDSELIFFPEVTHINTDAMANAMTEGQTEIARLITSATSMRSSSENNFPNLDSISISSLVTESERINTTLPDITTGWKTCVTSRTREQRDNYCKRNFIDSNQITHCKSNFCDKCCDSNANSGHINILHICKKTCYRSNLGETRNEDYKETCFNSKNPTQSIYNYCAVRMKDENAGLIKLCKLDMCNLCCLTMDPMNKKNYSMDVVKMCLKDCSLKFNSND